MRRTRCATRLRAGGIAYGVMAFEFFTPGPGAGARGGRRGVRAARHGAQRRRHRHDQGADRVRARRGHRADGARARSCAYHLIAPVLDAGALGIMAPMVETREQAEALVARAAIGRKAGAGWASAWRTIATRPAQRVRRWRRPTKRSSPSRSSNPRAASRMPRRSWRRPDSISAWLGHYDLSDSLGCAEDFDDPRYRRRRAAAARGRRQRRTSRWAGSC